MEFHKPTKELLDRICNERDINAFEDSFDREILVSRALDRLGFTAEAKAMTSIGRPKKGELSRNQTLMMMRNSQNPALRYLAFVVRPTKRNGTNQYWLYRLVQKFIETGMSRDQAAWHLSKNLSGFEYKDICKAFDRENKKSQKD